MRAPEASEKAKPTTPGPGLPTSKTERTCLLVKTPVLEQTDIWGLYKLGMSRSDSEGARRRVTLLCYSESRNLKLLDAASTLSCL